ncbi:MAG: 2-oxoglutarate dehydrogenase E1 component [Longimicrobiales bacterium]
MALTLFDSQNVGYVQALYEEYARNPEAVPEEWRAFFEAGSEVTSAAGLLPPDGLRVDEGDSGPGGVTGEGDVLPRTKRPPLDAVRSESPGMTPESVQGLLLLVAQATSFIQAFRDHGHMLSQIDPLGAAPPGHPQLDPSFFGTSMEELEQLPASVVMEGDTDETLAAALHRLQDAYCGPIGYEFEHLEDPARVRWLWSQVESGVHTRPIASEEKLRLLQRLTEVEGLEQFLHKTYLGQKRFSIEGTDMLVPMLDLALDEAAHTGGRCLLLGMAHRGRLNVLAHVIGVGYREVLTEFEGIHAKGAFTVAGTGDVKYHHGAAGEHSVAGGGSIEVMLAPNPSHLEFVNPVIQGMTRVRQFQNTTQDASQDTASIVPLLIHGDAAFAGEGVVAETLNIGRLAGYTTGGTVHIIVNNQIGFTTAPGASRSTRYSSDLAKGFSFPIVHVNADEPEACLAAVRLAMAYRAEYHDDVVIDLVGYRRYGHNEGDEPAYTQPAIYADISTHDTVRALFAERLTREGIASEAEVAAMQERVYERLRNGQDAVREEGANSGDEAFVDADIAPPSNPDTAVDIEGLREANSASLAWPESFTVHPKLERQLAKRAEKLEAHTPVDWAHAEVLAFGSLLGDGVPVRLTGQDTERGTFSHRHLVLHDAKTGEEFVPLASYGKARFEVYNSPLSEMAIVGFEYGYSVGAGPDLVLWEAQFGDFANAAQVSIDQFVSSGWEKWGQHSSLVMLLPHGYEGQGPEHSSARLERFLQLCAESNMRIVYPSTSAQFFHLLRRQAMAHPARPLVVMSPKSLLRHPKAGSTVAELVDGAFQPVIDDPTVADADAVRRALVCTGKIYYDLLTSDQRADTDSVALVRVEELYPFPGDAIKAVLSRYPSLEEVVWVQEEPRNMGALSFVGPQLRAAVPRSIRLKHVARPDRASPAEGKHIDHVVEQARLIRDAFTSG